MKVKQLTVVIMAIFIALLGFGFYMALHPQNAMCEETQVIETTVNTIDTYRTKTLKKVNNKKIYKSYLTKKQKQTWNKKVSNIKTAKTIKTIDKNYNSIVLLSKKGKKHKTYVDKWTKRIEKYLKNSPMEGCGKYYAEAAWQNDIDPRWAPAISCIESGKGRAYIKGTYNVWGWGCGRIHLGSSWKSSINNYVKKLKAGYGSSLTMRAAQKYCGSYWYYSVKREIDKI